MWTLPNLLSLFRILLVPFLAYLLAFTDPVSCALAALIFIIASVTDMLDGYSGAPQQERIRLRQAAGSPGGQAAGGNRPSSCWWPSIVPETRTCPPWLVVIIVAREVAVTVLRGIALSEGIIISADEVGKYKMLVQTFALVGLMLHYPYLGIDFFVAGMYFLWLSTVLAVWSGVEYHVRFLRSLRARSRPA